MPWTPIAPVARMHYFDCAEAADASDCLASDSWLHGLTIVVESTAWCKYRRRHISVFAPQFKHTQTTPTRSTPWIRKKQDTKLLPVTFPNVNRFSILFHWQTHWWIYNKFFLNIPPHLKYVAIMKYECQKNGGNLKHVLWLMINHKITQPNI